MIEKNITPERILYDLWSHCKLTILQLKKKKRLVRDYGGLKILLKIGQ